MADFTIAQGQVIDWTLLDDTATDAPTATTGSKAMPDGTMELDLHIVVAHIDTNDAAASRVKVVVSVSAGAGDDDEDWRELVTFESGGGQATSEGLDDNTSGTTIPVDATGDWDDGDGGVWLFLKDVGTLADSCLVFIVGWADGVSYTSAWAMENSYDGSDELYDTVSQHRVKIPVGSYAYRVDFFNTHGTATYAVRADFSSVTDLE